MVSEESREATIHIRWVAGSAKIMEAYLFVLFFFIFLIKSGPHTGQKIIQGQIFLSSV